ncbi:heavy metal-associated isoprenylated plant protein 6 [Telopea speciosissima]|uniref:heavy metal-associated isoprenylated plant protein 6 n=1 Tax=Telopea speciosissima TaxID=54955 RepID=UPI001CC3AD0B|nr:heavy metal-associated isoprenylated plant protein 6 [Telopea speciosissima]
MANLQIVQALSGKSVEPQHVEMMVPLYSYGCGRKIKKALLSHFRGIYSVTVDYKLQKVTVWGICNKYDVLATIRRKRKEARFWDIDQLPSYHHHQDEPTCSSSSSSLPPPPPPPPPPPATAATTTMMSIIPNKLCSLSLYWRTWKNKKGDLLRSYYRKH